MIEFPHYCLTIHLMTIAGLINKLRAWPLNIHNLIYYDTIIMLAKKVSTTPDHSSLSLVEYKTYDPSVIDIYKSLNRYISDARIRSRFRHNLRFYQLILSGNTVATTWLVLPGTRFIDEISYHYQINESSLWLRDIFVAPKYRGQKIFSRFLDVLFHRVFIHCQEIWSDTSLYDTSSVRAHLNYGFKIADSMAVIHLAHVVMARLKVPTSIKYSNGFKINRRILITSHKYNKYRNEHLA